MAADTLRILLKNPSQISSDLQAFLLDCQSRNLSPGTIKFYRQKLHPLSRYLEDQGLADVSRVTATHLRGWLVHLQETNHNPGGCHGFYRAAKAWFSWLLAEDLVRENPMRRVKGPKVPDDVLEPVSSETIRALLAVCGKDLAGARDRAVILALADSGCRAAEFCALQRGDFNSDSGALLVREGKGRKARQVYLGARSRREMLKYLRLRGEPKSHEPLFATESGAPLHYSGLRDILRRRAKEAGIAAPTLHSFRRFFALACLRGGMDVISLQRLLGHANLAIINRYLRQTEGDLQQAHQRAGPVDNVL